MFIPRHLIPKKHYAVYEPGIKTKAATLKEALKIAERIETHAEFIDFIPSKFSLQVHFWYDVGAFKNLEEIKGFIKSALKEGKDPVKEIEKAGKGKAHYDLRIKKRTAPSWFGLTPFRAPWTGTIEDKVLGTVKGYQSLSPGGEKLQTFLAEAAEKSMAKEGIAERRDRIEWMQIKAQMFPINSPGNPQKNQPAAMVAIEFFKPACLHRRQLDFFDITFFGDYLKGRYFNRLVERKMNQDEMTEWQKEAIKQGKAKAFFNLSFYFWKAKEQWGDEGTPYSMKDVYQAALGKKTLAKIPAPPSKKEPKKSKIQPPSATKEFH